MGRKKLPIKRIEDKTCRRVTFSKRRTGLIKKARDLSVLCDVDVALVVFSAGGKLYDFPTGDSFDRIIQRYKNRTDAKGRSSTSWCETERGLSRSHETCLEITQILDRKLDEPDLNKLSVTDLRHLEEELATALTHVRSVKTELMMKPLLQLEEQKKMLEEENKVLREKLAASITDGNDGTSKKPCLLQLL